MLYRFKEEQLEHSFSKYGFAIKKYFLSNDNILKFIDLIAQYGKEINNIKGFATSTDFGDQEFKMAIRNQINELIPIEKINKFIEGYSLFYSNLIIKKSSLNSEMCLHTDWSITDENTYRPLQIWIPLIDVNELNGTLGVIPASQQFTIKKRGLNIDEPYVNYINSIDKQKYIYYFNVAAGTAVFYHPGIIHYSPPNFSANTRFAILVSLYPAAKPPILYYNNKFLGFSNIELYELTNDFFSGWDKKSRPTGLKIIGRSKNEKPTIRLKEIMSFMVKNKFSPI